MPSNTSAAVSQRGDPQIRDGMVIAALLLAHEVADRDGDDRAAERDRHGVAGSLDVAPAVTRVRSLAGRLGIDLDGVVREVHDPDRADVRPGVTRQAMTVE